MKSEKVVSIWL